MVLYLDSADGVKMSLNYAVSEIGLPSIPEKEMESFIGPPIEWGIKMLMQELLNM